MVGPKASIRVGVVAFLVLLQACGGAVNSSATVPSPLHTVEPTPTQPADAAPRELEGRWTTVIGPGDNATLIIEGTGFSIARGGASGRGQISVHGNQIEFSRVQTCPDVTGTYTWKLSGATLTFTPVGPDPCPRAFVLKEHEFRRLAT